MKRVYLHPGSTLLKATQKNKTPIPSEHPNPTTKIGSQMGGAFTNPNQNGIRSKTDLSQPYTRGLFGGGRQGLVKCRCTKRDRSSRNKRSRCSQPGPMMDADGCRCLRRGKKKELALKERQVSFVRQEGVKYIYIYMCIYIYIYICVCVCVWVCLRVSFCIYMCVPQGKPGPNDCFRGFSF